MKKRKKIWILAVAVAVVLTFVLSPLSRLALSTAVMQVYSGIHERESIQAEKDIRLEIPGGGITGEDDWYPFVMTFNPSGKSFASFADAPGAELTILYNFPAFDLRWNKGCSRLYDPDSPYYNGFYGAYLVTGTETPFGFTETGGPDLAQTGLVPQYDFQRLVLRDFGIQPSEQTFRWEVLDAREHVSFLGYEEWYCVDAQMLVNGAQHEAGGFVQSYLQYGAPRYPLQEGEEPFRPVSMLGRVYGRYFEEWDTSVFFYVMAREPEVLEDCDEKILRESVLGPKAGIQ